MKDDFLRLIEQVDAIEKLFHTIKGQPIEVEKITDIQEFQNWKNAVLFELEDIYTKIKDDYINETIIAIKGINSYHERQDFKEIKGKLLTIRKNVDKYYIAENNSQIADKASMIFISHSTKDREYAKAFVTLLEAMGLDDQNVFCSSVPGYDVKIGKDIYEYLRYLFNNRDLHIIYLLSKNFYDSAASLNEMGAAWVLKKEVTTILLPGFDFSAMDGVVSNREVAIKLDNDREEVNDKLSQLYEKIIEEFDLTKKSNTYWDRKRNEFLDTVSKIPTNKEIKQIGTELILSDEAKSLLKDAVDSKDQFICVISDICGKSIVVDDKRYEEEQMGKREFVKWEEAVEELIRCGFIKDRGKKREIFEITNAGYKYADMIE